MEQHEVVQAARIPGPRRWFGRVVVWAFILGYWFIAWRLERIEYEVPFGFWRAIIGVYPLFDVFTPYVLMLSEFVSPRVLRHFIPALAGWYLAGMIINRFLISFYDLADSDETKDMLGRLLNGSSVKSIALKRDTFDSKRESEPILRLGGPGNVKVSTGSTVVTERNGRFHRILGSGMKKLDHFEYPVAIVEVRPQERGTQEAKVMTADGIELNVELNVTFQINPGKDRRSEKKPFPFDKVSVKKNAYAQTNLGDGKVGSWEARPLGMASGQLARIVSGYRLDQILSAEQNNYHIHQKIKNEMDEKIREDALKQGILIRGTRLGALKPPDTVREQHLSYWQAYWDRLRRVQIAEGEADRIEDMELVRAEAEAIMVRAIVAGLQRARRRSREPRSKEIIALRLIEALEVLARQSQQVVPLPDDLMPKIENIRHLLLFGDSEDLDLEH